MTKLPFWEYRPIKNQGGSPLGARAARSIKLEDVRVVKVFLVREQLVRGGSREDFDGYDAFAPGAFVDGGEVPYAHLAYFFVNIDFVSVILH